MIKGNDILLRLGGGTIAAARSVNVTLTQKVKEYTPLPGSLEADGWKRYRRTGLEWSVDHDGLYTDTSTELLDVDDTAGIEVKVGDQIVLEGTGMVSEFSVQAANGTLAKLSAKVVCNDFPTAMYSGPLLDKFILDFSRLDGATTLG